MYLMIPLRIVIPDNLIRIRVKRSGTVLDIKDAVAKKLQNEFPIAKQRLFLGAKDASTESLDNDIQVDSLKLKRGQKIFMRPVQGFVSNREAQHFRSLINERGGARNYERILYIEERLGTSDRRRKGTLTTFLRLFVRTQRWSRYRSQVM